MSARNIEAASALDKVVVLGTVVAIAAGETVTVEPDETVAAVGVVLTTDTGLAAAVAAGKVWAGLAGLAAAVDLATAVETGTEARSAVDETGWLLPTEVGAIRIESGARSDLRNS